MKRRIAALLGFVVAATVLGAPTASADPPKPPDFKMPVPCGQTWVLTTYEGHSPDPDGPNQDDMRLDMFRVGGETKGTTAMASAAGTVTWRDTEIGGINIRHAGGWYSQYLHMTKTVPMGTKVKAGDRLGSVSNEGTGAVHLHYQQMYDSDGDGAGEETELVHPTIQGKEYKVTPEKPVNVKSKNKCDGGDPNDPPKAEKTTLKYTGDTSISNGSRAQLSAALKTSAGKAVAGREVSFALGSGDGAQSCKAKTNSKGTAACPIDAVKQTLQDDATVPVTATFKGDSKFETSKDSADVKQQYVTGRAFGLSAKLPVLVIPVTIDPVPDTGTVKTAGEETKSPECTQKIDALLLSSGALCAEVKTKTGPSSSTSTSTVADTSVGLPGLPVVELSGVKAESTSSCSFAKGSVNLDLSVAGTPVTIPDTPGYGIDLGLGAKLVVNEQTQVKGADKGITVNAVHLTAPGGVDVVIGSSTSSAHNCA